MAARLEVTLEATPSGRSGSGGSAPPSDLSGAVSVAGESDEGSETPDPNRRAGIGSLRMSGSASGLGASSATSSSIWRFDLWTARDSTASRFSTVRIGASLAIPDR
jgi:hypothetical protein